MTDLLLLLTPLLATTEPPALGPQRRPAAWSLAEVIRRTDEALAAAPLDDEAASLVRSLVLLWHDHLDASHELSQDLHSADGSFLHGLMHRREPDFGNAAYWFRRVGDHPVYPRLADQVAALPDRSEFKSKLTAGGRWQPLAMIDACEAVEVEAADAGDADFLRTVQACEYRLLLEKFCAAPGDR